MAHSNAAALEWAIRTLTPDEPIHLDSTIICMPYFGRSVMIG